jgi:hypothetical protein
MIVKPFGVRDECKQWTADGRAGFCDYRLDHTVALVELAERNDELLAITDLAMPIQVIGAGDEKYVSNGKISNLANGEIPASSTSLCFLPEDVPHEMLTPHENAGREMHWLEGLLNGLVKFVAAGYPVPTRPLDDSGTPACVLE